MTLTDIKNEIAALGFESEVPLDYSLKSAVQRALDTVYTERSVHGTLRLYQRCPRPKKFIEALTHKGGGEELVEGVGRTYQLCTSGKGSFTVSDGRGDITCSFDGERHIFSGELYGAATLRFLGEYGYTVTDIAFFDEAFPEGKLPFEYGMWREYALSELAPDFLCLAELPTDKRGKDIQGAHVCCDRLCIPYGYVGEINLKYRRQAPRVSLDAPDEELDLPRETAFLVAMLAASFIWLDDDAERAQYYRSLYREGMSAVKLYDTRCLEAEYSDVTGWA